MKTITGCCLYGLLAASFISTAIFLQHSTEPKQSFFASWMSMFISEHNQWIKNILTNLSLLIMFAGIHSLQSTTSFKDSMTRLAGQSTERVLHAVISVASLSTLLYCWHPLPGMIYDVTYTRGTLTGVLFRLLLRFGEWFGWLLMLSAICTAVRYDQFRYFEPDPDVNQAMKILTNPKTRPVVQRVVREPLFVSLIYIAWSQPRLSLDRLLLNMFFTLYICIGSLHQEKQAEKSKFGVEYQQYKQEVPMVFPIGRLGLVIEKSVYQLCTRLLGVVKGGRSY